MTSPEDSRVSAGQSGADVSQPESSIAPVPAGVLQFVGPLLMLIAGAWALSRAWPMGPDIQVDFGRELYVPWRISEGDRLYLDIAYFNGPLSAHWNALCFTLFGTGLSTLKILNLGVAIAIAALFYRLLVAISDRFAASVAGIFFTGAVAFGQSLKIGNYNYLTPYSHELTHGIALSLLGLVCLGKLGGDASQRRVALRTGAILGLVFLTKSEVFAAFAAALIAAFALDHWCASRKPAKAFALARALLLSFVCTVAGVSLLIALVSGPDVAIAGVVEPWRSLANAEVTSLPYYRWVMGTLSLAHSFSLIGEWLVRYTVFFAALLGVSLAWRGPTLASWAPLSALFFAALLFAFPLDAVTALQSPRPLAVLIPLALVFSVFELARQKKHGGAEFGRGVLRSAVLAFCLVLQLKMALNTQFNHYGFALVVPSVLVAIVAAISLGASWVRRHSGSQTVFRLGVAAAVAWIAIGIAGRSEEHFERRTVLIGEGRDQMLSDARASQIKRALEVIEQVDPEATLAVLPEGIMLNYLTRRVNPTRHINFMPPELLLYGPQKIVEAFRKNPPDYVILMHKNTRLYGYPYFGEHYGRLLYRWVLSNYKAVLRVGAVPFKQDSKFGIVVLKRSAQTSPRATSLPAALQ